MAPVVFNFAVLEMDRPSALEALELARRRPAWNRDRLLELGDKLINLVGEIELDDDGDPADDDDGELSYRWRKPAASPFVQIVLRNECIQIWHALGGPVQHAFLKRLFAGLEALGYLLFDDRGQPGAKAACSASSRLQ